MTAPTAGAITSGDVTTMAPTAAGSSSICYTAVLMIACTLLSYYI